MGLLPPQNLLLVTANSLLRTAKGFSLTTKVLVAFSGDQALESSRPNHAGCAGKSNRRFCFAKMLGAALGGDRAPALPLRTSVLPLYCSGVFKR